MRKPGAPHCSAHAERLRLHGSLGPAAIKVRPDPRAVLAELLRSDPTDECIVWPLACTPAGYGVLRIGGVVTYTHRLACEMRHGPPTPERPEAAHSCHNRPCMNPRHLRWASSEENTADMLEAGRASNGR